MFDKIFALKIPASEVDSYIHNYTCSIYLLVIPGGLNQNLILNPTVTAFWKSKDKKRTLNLSDGAPFFNMCLSLQTSKNMSPFIYIADIPCR